MTRGLIGKRAGKPAKSRASLSPALRQIDGMVGTAGSALIEQLGKGDWLRMLIGHPFRLSG